MNLPYDTELDSDGSYDCASYIYPRSQWSRSDINVIPELEEELGFNNKLGLDEQNCCFSAAKLKQFELAESTRLNRTGGLYEEDYYPEEYNNLVTSYINLEDAEYFQKLEKKFGDFSISLADEVMTNRRLAAALAANDRRVELLLAASARKEAASAPQWNRKASSPSPEELSAWRELQDRELYMDKGRGSLEGNLRTPRSPQLQCMVDEHLQGFGEKRPDHWEPPQEDQNRKRRLCRHFLKGHCKRGKACDFLHDSSIFCPDLQKVFLGGLPSHIVEATLRQKLAEQGYTVINKPKVLRGFTPQVCLGSVVEAQRLIEKGKILIDGSQVDVRPYEAFAKDNLEKKLPDDIKRSVFLGGLPNGTTGQMIKEELEKMDVKVVNHPLIKAGFTPQVMLGSVAQAQMLVNLKKVRINETLVDVRPYVNFRERSSLLGSPSPSRKKY